MAQQTEWNDIYDENRMLTGRLHKRGTPRTTVRELQNM